MTKQECAIVTAYTEISMLRGDDLKYLYRYLSEIIGRPVYSHEIPAVCEQFRDRIKADFIALSRNASDDTEPEVRQGRWIDTPLPNSRVSKCSLCGFWQRTNGDDKTGKRLIHNAVYRYCAGCGARMDGGTDDAGR